MPALSGTLLAYLYLTIAVMFNMVTVYSVKKADGFTQLWPSVIAMVTICITQALFSKAMQAGLEVGLASAIISVAVIGGAIIMGVMLFNEPMPPLKLAGLLLAVIGVALASWAK